MRSIVRTAMMVTWGALAVMLPGAGQARGQVTCDSLYPLLQNFAVNHVGGNEVWVDYFIACPSAPDTIGGFVLSEVGQQGKKDRAVLARWIARAGWQYRFGERASNIRFAKPSPRMDVDGDDTLDLIFEAADDAYPSEHGYRVLMQRGNTYQNLSELRLPRGVIIDSVLSAPRGQPHPMVLADRRGWEVGGLRRQHAPVSYQYVAWDASADPPRYVNRTTSHTDLFPEMERRAAYVGTLAQSGELTFRAAEEYEAFLSNVIGYCLDQYNMNREKEGFETVSAILDRTRYGGPTERLQGPRQVRDGLIRAVPSLRNYLNQKP
jgi:hypothetical protein